MSITWKVSEGPGRCLLLIIKGRAWRLSRGTRSVCLCDFCLAWQRQAPLQEGNGLDIGPQTKRMWTQKKGGLSCSG